jgi:hypothetical protein
VSTVERISHGKLFVENGGKMTRKIKNFWQKVEILFFSGSNG